MPKCKCGGEIVLVDSHFICENYFKIIKENIENLQAVIAVNAEDENDEDET